MRLAAGKTGGQTRNGFVLFLTHFIADFAISRRNVRNDIVVLLGSSDLDLADFQILPIDRQVCADAGQIANGIIEHDKARELVHADNFADLHHFGLGGFCGRGQSGVGIGLRMLWLVSRSTGQHWRGRE